MKRLQDFILENIVTEANDTKQVFNTFFFIGCLPFDKYYSDLSTK